MKKTETGFSLIEMMIAIAIIGILIAVAYPSYQEKIRQTRRTEAIALTTKIMQAEERFFVNNLTYTTNLTLLGFSAAANLPTENGHYQLTAQVCAGDIAICVNIVSTAQGGQAVDGDIEYNNRGETQGHWND